MGRFIESSGAIFNRVDLVCKRSISDTRHAVGRQQQAPAVRKPDKDIRDLLRLPHEGQGAVQVLYRIIDGQFQDEQGEH